MKFFSIFLIFPSILARLFTKIVHTPIYESNQLFNAHHVVLMKDAPFIGDETLLKNVYILDFSPSNDITKYETMFNIFLGKKIPGKVRILHIDTCDLYNIIPPCDYVDQVCSLNDIKHIDRKLYNKVLEWDTSFQLYTHNCQHFARYIHCE
jgi:hypothetical protein